MIGEVDFIVVVLVVGYRDSGGDILIVSVFFGLG